MERGGANAVRAYPEGEAYADEGVLLTLEQGAPRAIRDPEQLQLIGFVDLGSVHTNARPWVDGDTAAPERRRRRPGRLHENGWVAKVSYARRLGNEKARSAPDARAASGSRSSSTSESRRARRPFAFREPETTMTHIPDRSGSATGTFVCRRRDDAGAGRRIVGRERRRSTGVFRLDVLWARSPSPSPAPRKATTGGAVVAGSARIGGTPAEW